MSRQNIEKSLREYAGGNATLDKKLRREVSTRAFTHEINISVTKLKESFVRAKRPRLRHSRRPVDRLWNVRPRRNPGGTFVEMANTAAKLSSPVFGFRRNDVLDAIFVV